MPRGIRRKNWKGIGNKVCNQDSEKDGEPNSEDGVRGDLDEGVEAYSEKGVEGNLEDVTEGESRRCSVRL
jgi:hypothetical protein